MKGKEKIAAYWDEIQGAKHKHGHEFQIQELSEIFAAGSVEKVLDTACGTGTLVIGLARLGYECMGIDIDDDMLAAARKKVRDQGFAVEFAQGDMRDLRLEPGKKFDAVTCFQALSLLETPAEMRAVFRGVRRVLMPRGLFIFDVLCTAAASSGAGPGAGPGVEPGAGPVIRGPSRPFSPPPFIDTALEKENLKIVRLNRMRMAEDSQQWDAIYFFEENGNVSLEMQSIPLKVYEFGEIGTILAESGFAITSVTSGQAAGPKRKNMRVCACPAHPPAGEVNS